MNILMPHASFEIFGGAERVVAKLATYLSRNGNHVHVITNKCPPDLYTRFLGCEITTGSYNKLKEFVHDNYTKFDIVNSHNHPMELTLWPKKMPHVWSFNEFPFYVLAGDPINPVERNIVNSSVNVAVVANKKNESIYHRIYNTPTFINMYGIDPELYYSGDGNRIRDKFNLGNSFVISVVAWVHLFKRQRDVLESFMQLHELIPNTKLVLAGEQEPSETEYLRTTAANSGIGDDVVLTGHLSVVDAKDLYFASNVIACPFWEQGSYLNILESLCTQKPVIVSNRAMLADDLIENNVGIVTNDYTKAIIDIYENKINPDYDKWRKWASQFTWDRYCKNMEVLFNSLLAKE